MPIPDRACPSAPASICSRRFRGVFEKAGLPPRDLQVVGVSIGPGGFTGLRIAVTTAKMLAETLGVKVIEVPSALVAANAYKKDEESILIALASKRESAWITKLIRREGVWEIQGPSAKPRSATA